MYKYDNVDLLKNPEFYQMTPFEGSEFLPDYIESRKEIISMIDSQNNFTKFIELRHSFTTNFTISNKEDLFNHIIITNDLFIFLMNSILESKPSDLIIEIIDIFLKKFELTKKFFDSYTLQQKITSENFSDLKNYIIFSIICLKTYDDTKNLKYLNTCLKINDIIASNIRIKKNHDLSDLINFIINYEIDIVRKISRENDIIV